jgi:hypothetical protein
LRLGFWCLLKFWVSKNVGSTSKSWDQKILQGAQEFVKQIWEFMEHHPTNVCNYFIQKNVGISAK